MSITRHLGPICKGAGIGFLVGLASIATIDKKTLVVQSIVNKPVELVVWLAAKAFAWGNGTTALVGWFCTAVYWMLIGALIGWGVSVVYAKVTGDE